MATLWHRFSLMRQYALRRASCPYGPVELGVEPTNRCNLECVMCARQTMRRPVGNMDLHLFKEIVDQTKSYVEFMWLQDMGEPLLTKDVFEMVEYCKKNGVRSGISTNATALTRESSSALLRAGLDYMMFAVDGTSKDTYEKVRKGAVYEKTVANIEEFLRQKLDSGSKVYCVLQSIYMRDTAHEAQEYCALWNRAGVDAVRLRQVTYSVNPVERPDDAIFLNSDRNLPCYWLWRDPHIKWDGTMVACCQDIDATYPLGNVADTAVHVLWNSPKMQELRQAHILGRRRQVPLCRDCNMYQPSLAMVIASFPFHAFTLKRWLPSLETLLVRRRFPISESPQKSVGIGV